MVVVELKGIQHFHERSNYHRCYKVIHSYIISVRGDRIFTLSNAFLGPNWLIGDDEDPYYSGLEARTTLKLRRNHLASSGKIDVTMRFKTPKEG